MRLKVSMLKDTRPDFEWQRQLNGWLVTCQVYSRPSMCIKVISPHGTNVYPITEREYFCYYCDYERSVHPDKELSYKLYTDSMKKAAQMLHDKNMHRFWCNAAMCYLSKEVN